MLPCYLMPKFPALICSVRYSKNSLYCPLFCFHIWTGIFFPWDLDQRPIVSSLERWQDNQIICVKLWLNPCVVYSLGPGAWDFSNTVTKISARLSSDCNTASTTKFSSVLSSFVDTSVISTDFSITGLTEVWPLFGIFWCCSCYDYSCHLALLFTVQWNSSLALSRI